MPDNNMQKNNCASVTFRTIAHFYDPDDPTPENNRELSDRAETQIFHEVLGVAKGVHAEICANLEILLPASDLTPDRETAIISAIRSHFRLRADEVQRDMKLTQKVGLRSSG